MSPHNQFQPQMSNPFSKCSLTDSAPEIPLDARTRHPVIARLAAHPASSLAGREFVAQPVRLYSLAAAQGDADAQAKLGLMFENGRGVAQDYAEAVRLYSLAAAQGHADAQFYLGVMFENGRGVAQDDAEAVRLYSLAAAQGNAGAQFNLGYMFENGRGVAQDRAEAIRLYRLAAAQGNLYAQSFLARLGA